MEIDRLVHIVFEYLDTRFATIMIRNGFLHSTSDIPAIEMLIEEDAKKSKEIDDEDRDDRDDEDLEAERENENIKLRRVWESREAIMTKFYDVWMRRKEDGK